MFAELLSIAKRNVQRLQNTLASVLDLAELESGTFHARLREMDLVKSVRLALESSQPILSDRKIKTEMRERLEMSAPILADPAKLSRALEMMVNIISLWGEQGTALDVELTPHQVSFWFRLEKSSEPLWENYWSQAMVGFQSGVLSPSSAFAGTVGDEREFLTRTKEGLGSDLLLIHQIQKIHDGEFKMERRDGLVGLFLILPKLEQERQLLTVLASRIFEHSSGIGVVSLFYFKKPANLSKESVLVKLQDLLSKETDAVYVLDSTQEVFVIADDLKRDAVIEFSRKILTSLDTKLDVKYVTAPDDGVDAAQIIARLRT